MDLTKFCNPDDIRDTCRRPHTDGEFVYATNGHYAVRVPAGDYSDDAPLLDGSNIKAMREIFSGIEKEKFSAFPSFSVPEMVPCGACEASGTVSDCPECRGSGENECDCCGNSKDCDACNGSGQVTGDDDPCYACSGQGEVPVNRDWAVPFGPTRANFRYLQVFQSLPNVEASISQFIESPIRFRFNGGYGVLATIRTQEGAMK